MGDELTDGNNPIPGESVTETWEPQPEATVNHEKSNARVLVPKSRIEAGPCKPKQQNIPRITTTTVEVEDDRSSSSENTASSTSGCSSLVPSNQDHLQRLHLPKDSLDRLRTELMKKSHTALETLPEEPGVSRDTKKKQLWSSNSIRQFDVSKFLAPSGVMGAASPLNQRSPFYEGRTSYGGSAGTRRSLLASTSPYSNLQRGAPVLRIRASQPRNHNPSWSDKLSAAAKKILDSMDKISSPLGESNTIISPAAKSPHFENSILNQSLNRDRHRSSIPIRPVPPAVRDEGHRINWNLDFKKWADKTDVSPQTLSVQAPSVETIASSTGGGKMIRTKKSSDRISLRKDAQEEPAEMPELPQVSLPPMRSLPKFNILNHQQQTETREFTFSPPIPVKPSNDLASGTTSPRPLFLESNQTDSNHAAPVSSSFQVKTVVPSPVEVTSAAPVLPKEWWCDTCMIKNDGDKTKCAACETPRVTFKGAEGLKEKYSGYQFSSSLTQASSQKPFAFGSNSTSTPFQLSSGAAAPTFNSSSTANAPFLMSSGTNKQNQAEGSISKPIQLNSSPPNYTFSPPAVVSKEPFSFLSGLSNEATQNNMNSFNSNSRFH